MAQGDNCALNIRMTARKELQQFANSHTNGSGGECVRPWIKGELSGVMLHNEIEVLVGEMRQSLGHEQSRLLGDGHVELLGEWWTGLRFVDASYPTATIGLIVQNLDAGWESDRESRSDAAEGVLPSWTNPTSEPHTNRGVCDRCGGCLDPMCEREQDCEDICECSDGDWMVFPPRQITGTPDRYYGYIGRGVAPEAHCHHGRHRSERAALACAGRATARYNRRASDGVLTA